MMPALTSLVPEACKHCTPLIARCIEDLTWFCEDISSGVNFLKWDMKRILHRRRELGAPVHYDLCPGRAQD